MLLALSHVVNVCGRSLVLLNSRRRKNCLSNFVCLTCSKEKSPASFPVFVISSRINFFKSYKTSQQHLKPALQLRLLSCKLLEENKTVTNDDLILTSLAQRSAKLLETLLSFAHALTASSSGTMMATAHDLRLSP